MTREPDRRRRAVGDGGPLDGHDLGESGVERFEVTMADGSRHLYVRSGSLVGDESGLEAEAYRWRGRVGPVPS